MRALLTITVGWALGVFVVPNVVMAQPTPPQRLERLAPEARAEADAELAEVDYQASLATAGYVASVISHLIGAGLTVTGALMDAFGSFCLGFAGDCYDRERWRVVTGLGIGIASVGLIGIFVSIAVHVDSHERRREIHHRHGLDVDLTLAPTDRGAALAVVGRF